MPDNKNNLTEKEALVEEIRQTRENINALIQKIARYEANQSQKAEPVRKEIQPKPVYRRAKMKVWKLVSGILSIILSLFVVGQSFLAGIFNALTENHQISGTAGLVVAVMLLTAGIVSIAVRNSEGNGGNVALLILFGIAAAIGFTFAGEYKDLYIWSGWCALCALLAIISMIKRHVKEPEKAA